MFWVKGILDIEINTSGILNTTMYALCSQSSSQKIIGSLKKINFTDSLKIWDSKIVSKIITCALIKSPKFDSHGLEKTSILYICKTFD